MDIQFHALGRDGVYRYRIHVPLPQRVVRPKVCRSFNRAGVVGEVRSRWDHCQIGRAVHPLLNAATLSRVDSLMKEDRTTRASPTTWILIHSI